MSTPKFVRRFFADDNRSLLWPASQAEMFHMAKDKITSKHAELGF